LRPFCVPASMDDGVAFRLGAYTYPNWGTRPIHGLSANHYVSLANGKMLGSAHDGRQITGGDRDLMLCDPSARPHQLTMVRAEPTCSAWPSRWSRRPTICPAHPHDVAELWLGPVSACWPASRPPAARIGRRCPNLLETKQSWPLWQEPVPVSR
jgi:hypothetical protein